MNYANDELYLSFTQDLRDKIDAIMRINPEFYPLILKMDQDYPGYRQELISQQIVSEYAKRFENVGDQVQAEEKGRLYVLNKNQNQEIMNQLVAALQPFQKQSFITLDRTSEGWDLTISKNCRDSNIFGIGINCCNTVTEFIKKFNSAIARVYRDNKIPDGTPLINFFGSMKVTIKANFWDKCINIMGKMDKALDLNDMNSFLGLIGVAQNQFPGLDKQLQRYQSPRGGRHRRHNKHRSSHKTHKKQSKRRVLKRKHTKRR